MSFASSVLLFPRHGETKGGETRKCHDPVKPVRHFLLCLETIHSSIDLWVRSMGCYYCFRFD